MTAASSELYSAVEVERHEVERHDWWLLGAVLGCLLGCQGRGRSSADRALLTELSSPVNLEPRETLAPSSTRLPIKGLLACLLRAYSTLPP